MVRSGGEEVRQQIAVCAVDLDEVEAGDLRAPGRVAEGVDYVLDLLDGQHVGHGLQAVLIPQLRPGDGARRAHGLCAQELLAAAVLDLDAGGGAALLDVFSQPGEAGDVLVLRDAEVAVRALGADVVHIGILDNDHARTAGGLVAVIAYEALGYGAVLVAHAGRLRRLHYAVLELQGAYAARRKDMRKQFACHGFTSLAGCT